jgi:hypothetical protein
LGVRPKTDDFALQNIYAARFKEMKTGRNVSESSKEGYGSKMSVFPMTIMMIQ